MTNLYLLSVVTIFLAAGLVAVGVVGLVAYRSGRKSAREKKLSETEAVEITSTWNSLNH
jgi:hypothetical protein